MFCGCTGKPAVGDVPGRGDGDDVPTFDRPCFDILPSRATSVAIAATIATAASRVRKRRCVARFISSSSYVSPARHDKSRANDKNGPCPQIVPRVIYEKAGKLRSLVSCFSFRLDKSDPRNHTNKTNSASCDFVDRFIRFNPIRSNEHHRSCPSPQ